MAPTEAVRTISQQTFDEMVKENMDDLGMDPAEALEDAVQTLTLQGVDLSGIVRCVPGEGTVSDNPVIQSLDRLKQLNSNWTDHPIDDQKDLDEAITLLEKLTNLCSVEGSENVAIATKNGGIELVCSVCSKFRHECERGLVSALNTMASLLYDVRSSEIFQKSGGSGIVVGIMTDRIQNLKVLNSGFLVVAAAATGNEILKESFMDLKVDEIMVQILRDRENRSIHGIYDAIRVLLTPDDNRVVASQVYGYARRFAKIGIAEALVDALHDGPSSPSLVSASIALKSVAVNDEICRSIAENGGIDAVLQCIGDSIELRNKTVARACCSLLSKLAGSDTIKSAIVEKRGMDRLINLSATFSEDPFVLQEVMAIICALCLRSPGNAAQATEAGAGDLAIQAMQKFPGASQMQRNSCMMIRNLVVRNPENRTLLLGNGIEKLIREAKENHESCKDAATDALRDLGLDNYNL